MGKFASAAVGGMEYDLTRWRPDPDAPDLTDDERERRRRLAGEPWAVGEDTPCACHGHRCIPEPSREASARFFDQMQDIRLASMEEVDRITREHRETVLQEWRAAHPQDTDTTDDQILERAAIDETVEQTRARVARIQSVRQAAHEKQSARIAEVVEDLTQGHPTAAVVLELGQRPMEMFVGWLTGEFSPESVAAAMQQ